MIEGELVGCLKMYTSHCRNRLHYSIDAVLILQLAEVILQNPTYYIPECV
jgi:hypothetical protein